jgi:ribonuclease PH
MRVLFVVLVYFGSSLLISANAAYLSFEESNKIFERCKVHSKLEDLTMTAIAVKEFVACCSFHFYNTSHLVDLHQNSDQGPDGRDLISMTAFDIRDSFMIEIDLSMAIHAFISNQLTAHLPSKQ